MPRVAYVNGLYVPHVEAAVHVEDRGYQFADGAYEVIAIHGGRLVDEAGHLARLRFSLGELRLAWPMSERALKLVMRELIRRNRMTEGIIYLQVTRGVAPRNHAFPEDGEGALVMTVRRQPRVTPEARPEGVAVITIPDIRWTRRDIKSISLLPNVLGKQQAKEAGAYEAWMVDGEGFVTEGTSSNAWIVTEGGEMVTRYADQSILRGITRQAVADLARDEGIAFVERPFTVAEAKAAQEAFVTSTTSLVKPVVRIDGEPVGGGRPGPVSEKLFRLYLAHMEGAGGEQ